MIICTTVKDTKISKGAIHTYVCMLHGCSNVCISNLFQFILIIYIYYPVPYIKSKNDRNVQKKGINCNEVMKL